MKERNSNIELLRVVSMFGIIAMHYCSSSLGGMVQNAAFPNFSWFFNHVINSFSIPLVNCFVLITGYYLIQKTAFTFRKPVDLLITTAEYGILSWVIAMIAGTDSAYTGGGYTLCPVPVFLRKTVVC